MDTISLLSKKIYDLLVVNPYAVAIQQKNGLYYTKYLPYDYLLIESMIKSNGSAGCYQQGFKNGLIKWVCLDFDCKSKDAPQINELHAMIRAGVLDVLDELKISYLTEFSGRRGIHVWIVFDQYVSKWVGFEIVNVLMRGVCLDRERFDVDLFPKTDSSANNKVGLQVKFPLSCHKNGSRSFLFIDEIDTSTPFKDDFFEEQYGIVRNYKPNSVVDVCNKLQIDICKDEKISCRYRKYEIVNGLFLSAEDVITSLSKVKVFANIFARMKSGISMQKDWFVLLGTIGCIDDTGEILKSIFSMNASYDEAMTEKNIQKWKNKYYPATFEYLYKLYDVEMEEKIDPAETGLDIIARDYDMNVSVFESNKHNLKKNNKSIHSTLSKEKKYFLINDEYPVISIWNALNTMAEYDCKCLEEKYRDILNGSVGEKHVVTEYVLIPRWENENRCRHMVSLGAFDRVLTTHLALNVAYGVFEGKSTSYSYNVSFMSEEDIFYNWYTSWGNYIDKIKTYVEVPFMKDWGIITIDIKHFYDSIDFLSVYNLCKGDMQPETENAFKYLVNYNEVLMRNISGERFGVPQGPAYARIIAEIFMNKVLNGMSDMDINCEDYHVYRYVDDIIIFYKDTIDANYLFSEMKSLFVCKGLMLNEEKSKIYGPIGSLTEKEIREILRKDKFNYMYQKSDMNMLLPETQKRKVFSMNMSNNFSIEDLAYIFSEKTDSSYVFDYYYKYSNKIFSSKYGRGSLFNKFYAYIFRSERLLSDAIQNNRFEKIPINSLNFKSCISTLFLALQRDVVDKYLFHLLCARYIIALDNKEIDEEEKVTICSLLEWDKYNGEVGY